MSTAHPRPTAVATSAPRSGPALRLLRAAVAEARLLRRHRELPRRLGLPHCPARTWGRHSALLMLRAGIEPGPGTGPGSLR